MLHRAVRLVLTPLAFVLALAVPLAAETGAAPPPATVAGLQQAMKIPDIISVLRDEGMAYGASLEEELFPGRGGAAWGVAVDLIYDTPTMEERFGAALEREIGADTAALAAAVDFFAGERGQRILTLEVEARRALLDEAVEDAARARAEDMMADNDPRMDALRRFAEANDLIESNVQGALNANLAFYQGMAEAGAFGDEMTEEQMLDDVWGQEADVRAETGDWLFSYLALAYGPLPDEDLEAYTDFSLTPEGQKLNAALFAAFDAVFREISRNLGRAAARQMMGQDI